MPYQPTDRQKRCRYCDIYSGPNQDESLCTFEDMNVPVSASACEACDRYESLYIEFPLTVEDIDNKQITWHKGWHAPLCPVAVRPCCDDTDNKTFLGFYLGEFAAEIHTSWDKKTKRLTNTTLNNPAIYVPDLERVVWGYESWWHEIEDPTQLKDITDADIKSVWYMRALDTLTANNEKDES